MLPKILIIPFIVGFITQVAKVLWQAPSGRLTWRSFNAYGGMPSTHTAITVSLLTVMGFAEGVASPAFALAAVLALLVIRDAIGFRRYLGGHSRALNMIIRDLPAEEQRPFSRFREDLGHTPLEAFIGGIVGFSLSAILYLLFP